MKIKIYTTKTCPWCEKTKKFLKSKKVKFKEADISKNSAARREMIKKSGQLGVPVIDIDGTIIVGFNKLALKQALDIK